MTAPDKTDGRRSRRTRSVAQQIERRDAAMAALPIARKGEEKARLHLENMRDQQRSAILAYTFAAKVKAVNEVRTCLEPLIPALAKLVAIQMVQSELVGDRFPIPDEMPAKESLINGQQVVATFIARLLPILRPDKLTMETVGAQATPIAREIIKQVTKGIEEWL